MSSLIVLTNINLPMWFFTIVLTLFLIFNDRASIPGDTVFTKPVRVTITGYQGNAMEPFLSRDGDTLLFNNLNSRPENTNLHWALKINDSTFKYMGEIQGVNTNAIEGVASLDRHGNLFFVSDRSYKESLSTLYQCNFSNGTATNVHLVPGITKHLPGWVNFDIEVNAAGNILYFTDARFNAIGMPQTADIIIAHKTANGFKRDDHNDEIMENINTNNLEYAACISADELELYFTRTDMPFTPLSTPQLFVAKRENLHAKFSKPIKIESVTGFAEAPTISPDQKTIYFHKKDGNKFVLYMIKKY